MAALVWDEFGEHVFESGVDHGVLYRLDSNGAYTIPYAWNGLTAVKENPEGGDINSLYADNIKYLDLVGAENFKFTIEAYTYPDAFMECDGTSIVTAQSADTGIRLNGQTREKFGFAYRTKVGDDRYGQNKGYKLHLVYGCTASPSDKEYSTINDNPDAVTFSWEASATPVAVTGTNFKPTSCVTIDSTKCDPTKLAALEKILFGDASTDGELILPADIIEMLN